MTWDALVLGGGGVAGIAWETGVLLGLTETVPEIADRLTDVKTRYIGTSAGSTVAAQLASGVALQELFDAQIRGAAAEIEASIDPRQFGAMLAEATVGASSPEEVRRRIGAIARTADTPAAAARRAVIESRLPSRIWPTRDLRITAVDADTGRLAVFDQTSSVDLVDAVAASCAVPGIWPVVSIQGAWYMDGGTRSVANADLAAGAERVLILIPSTMSTPFGPAIPADEVTALDGTRTKTVYADDDALAAMGSNPLDPRTRGPAAEAGRRLGQRVAEEVASLWS